MKQERLKYVDYLKAITVIVVVLVHTGLKQLTPIGSMCMIALFVCFGFTSSTNEKLLKKTITKKFKRIILPFWGASIVYSFFEIWRGYYFQYADYKIIYPSILSMIYGSSYKFPIIPHITNLCEEIPLIQKNSTLQGFLNIILPTNCHLWFLPALFTGSIIFILYIRCVKKRGLLDVIMILIFLFLSYIESISSVAQFPFCLGRGFFASACMIIGLNLKHFDVFSFKTKNYIIFIISIILTFILFSRTALETAFIRSDYPREDFIGVLMLFVCGISITIFLLFLFKIISTKIKFKLISKIGENSIMIYLWHMLFVNIFGIILLRILNIPFELDKHSMSFISQKNIILIIIVAVLSIAACMMILHFKKLKGRIEND